MGLTSTLFGKKPKFVERSLGETQLLDNARSQLAAVEQGAPALRSYLADLGNSTAEEAKARGTSNADVMQATSGEMPFDASRPGVNPTQRALARTKALSRMGWAGASAAKEDSFQAKLQAVQFGKQVRAGNKSASQALSDVQYTRAAIGNALSAYKGAMNSNALGTIGGAALGAYANRDRSPPAPTYSDDRVGEY